MDIIKRKDNIRLVANYNRNSIIISPVKYKIQIKFFLFWITIKSFDEDDYYDACECFRYCTNPYLF